MSRWERLSLRDMEPKGNIQMNLKLNDNDVVTFGNYMGKKYKDVAKDPMYADHVIRTAELEKNASQAMKRLAHHLVRMESEQGFEPVPMASMDEEL